jgi:hypothetical protein
MACPSTTTLTGTGVVNVGFYSTRPAAAADASSLVQSRAEIEAGLKFNGFHCPEQLCQQKTLGPVTAITNSVTTSLSLMATSFWFAAKYEGRAEFSWSAAVTCRGDHSALFEQLLKQFAVAAAERYDQVDTIASDWLNNLLSWIGYGRGCADWADWIWGWLWNNAWPSKGVQVRLCWYWVHWPVFQHQVAVITMPDGRQYVLDPYTDVRHPIWDKEQYEREYGTLHCTN